MDEKGSSVNAITELNFSKNDLKWVINEMIERLGEVGMTAFHAAVEMRSALCKQTLKDDRVASLSSSTGGEGFALNRDSKKRKNN
jgi:hypothetical protein